jgi:hypothetical protein
MSEEIAMPPSWWPANAEATEILPSLDSKTNNREKDHILIVNARLGCQLEYMNWYIIRFVELVTVSEIRSFMLMPTTFTTHIDPAAAKNKPSTF